MKCLLVNSISNLINDKFPRGLILDKNDEKEFLDNYFNYLTEIINKISEICQMASDNSLNDFEFFKIFFEFFEIAVDGVLDNYFNDIFGKDYRFLKLKTMIPEVVCDPMNINFESKYHLQTMLSYAMFVVNKDFIVDLNHIYTNEEIKKMISLDQAVLLKLLDGFNKIDNYTYSILKEQFEKSDISFFSFNNITKYNYKSLIKSYPRLFAFLRKNINIDEIINDSRILIEKRIEKEIMECNDKIVEYNDRIERIKKLKKEKVKI